MIFICQFDAFGKGLHKYTFENTCKELPELSLGDETTKLFLCAGGNANDISDDMKDFLDWLCGKSSGSSKLVCGLDAAMQKARNHEEWRLEYMTLLMRDQEMIQKGREQGLQEGIAQGLQEGRISEIYELVQDGDLSFERAAEKIGVSISELVQSMEKAGYVVQEMG